MLPPDQYVASLARKRMAATAFFRDDEGRVLLVNPVYKDDVGPPGGAVEAEESPHAACRREVAEELGLDRPPGRVLAVDWVPSRPERPEGLIVVYDGGVLSKAEIEEIVLADGELAEFAFVAPDDVAGLVTPLLARRVASCLDAVAAGAVAALRTAARPPDGHPCRAYLPSQTRKSVISNGPCPPRSRSAASLQRERRWRCADQSRGWSLAEVDVPGREGGLTLAFRW